MRLGGQLAQRRLRALERIALGAESRIAQPRAALLAGLVIVSQVASTLGFLVERFSASTSAEGSQSSIGRN